MESDSETNWTYPHDYRLLCSGSHVPTVVGGQAVNLWALAYLEKDGPDLRERRYGSKDFDLLAENEVLEYLKTVPGWKFRPRDGRDWADQRQGFLHGTSADGRKLLVEVLRYVHGLEDDDLKHVETIVHEGQTYQLLNPIAMLKAKAANLRDFKQDEVPPRHDREHLRLIARCLPKYLRDIHAAGVKDGSLEKHTLTILSYAFKTLQDAKTVKTLVAEGINPRLLIPEEFKESPLARIRKACGYQLPRLSAMTETVFGESI